MEVGWYSYQHLISVCDNLLNGQYINALQQIELWQIRGVIPAAVAATQIILYEIVEEQMDPTNDAKNYNYLYADRHKISLLSMAFIRSLNLLVDQGQTMLYAKSISVIARDLGIPENLIQLRHRCCHGELPDFHSINQAIRYLLQLLIRKYWIPQSQLIRLINSSSSNYYIIKSLIEGRTNVDGYNNDKFVAMITLDLLVSSCDNFVNDRLKWVDEIVTKRGFNFALNLYSRAVALLFNFDGWIDNAINEFNISDYSWKSLTTRLQVYNDKFDPRNINNIATTQCNTSVTYGYSLDPLLQLLNIAKNDTMDRINRPSYYIQSLNIMLEYFPDKLMVCIKGLMDFCSKMIRSGNNDFTEIRQIWKSWMDLIYLIKLHALRNVNWQRVELLISAAQKAIFPGLDSINSTKYQIIDQNQCKNNKKLCNQLLSVGTYFCGRTWCVVTDEPDPSCTFFNLTTMDTIDLQQCSLKRA